MVTEKSRKMESGVYSRKHGQEYMYVNYLKIFFLSECRMLIYYSVNKYKASQLDI